ncbi:MAG: universal stress protein [Paracoccaceae bacterium]|jgi:nucleotide-binding universal stress UspA family protein
MIKTILVAVDGSDHALKAVDYSASIASAMNSELRVLYVLKSQNLPKGLLQYADAEHIIGGNKDILEKMAADIVTNAKVCPEEAGATNVTTEVIKGPVARSIVKCGKDCNVDMIVIGTRGMGNIEATLRGGVSHRVELLATVPVLSVR